MKVRTRFAPSPTGFLHIGGARTALYNWLFARKHDGVFVLRVEDTDKERSTGESQDVILEGLRWLGLDWDEGPGVDGPHGPYFQSERTSIYEDYFRKLEEADLVYEDEGAFRFRVPDREIEVNDAVCGESSINLKVQGSTRWDAEAKQEVEANPDLVIRRPDGSFIFHFVNVVDDIEMGMTHVIRGEDHLSNTPKHIALYDAFGAEPPVFAHIPLNLNPNGSKMSKRDQGALIHEYVEGGFLPDAVNNYMALLGWSSGGDRELYFSLEELLADFDLDGINQSNSKFDYGKCLWVNSEHIKALPADQLLEASSGFIEAAGIDASDDRVPAALELARERSEVLPDIPRVIGPVFSEELDYDEASVGKVVGKEGVTETVKALADGLETVEEWSEESIKGSIKDTAKAMDAKMGAFMLPCRVAVTGNTAGADLVPMLVLIGQEKVVKRIREFADRFLGK